MYTIIGSKDSIKISKVSYYISHNFTIKGHAYNYETIIFKINADALISTYNFIRKIEYIMIFLNNNS